MRGTVLGRSVEGDERGLNYLDSLDEAAEELFSEAKYQHRAEFKDHEGRHYLLTRAAAGRYVVARNDHG